MQQQMKTGSYIDAFIEQEKQHYPTPFLATRIMAAVEDKNILLTFLLKRSIIFITVCTFFFAGIRFVAVNNQTETAATTTEITIDDYVIENFIYLTYLDYE